MTSLSQSETKFCQILNETFDPTFHILRDKGDDHEEFLDVFLGSPLIACKACDYEVLKSDLDSIQSVQYHSAIQILLNFKNSNTNETTQTIKQGKFLFDKADWSKFGENLHRASLIDYTNLNSDELFIKLNLTLKTASIESIPIAVARRSSKQTLPKFLVKKIKERNKLQRIYKRHKSESNKKNLYSMVENVKCEITKFRSHQWSQFTSKLGIRPLSTKPFWNRINRL